MKYEVFFYAQDITKNNKLLEMNLNYCGCNNGIIVGTDDIFDYSKLLLMDDSCNINKASIGNSNIVWPAYRSRGDVDNQLGHLYDRVNRINKLKYKCLFTNPNVFIAKNVFDKSFAINVRDFLNQIPIDLNTEPLNDIDNKPKDVLFYSDSCSVVGNCNPKEWTWEHYAKNQIWRCLPLTLTSFVSSPIFKLIEALEQKFCLEFFAYAGKATWVLQRLCKGNFIGDHTDDSGTDVAYPRKFAFVYYLTPDDWDYNVDGGELCVKIGDQYIPVNPIFNSMVVWDMAKQKSPLHKVNEVLAENDRPRYALVGFLI